MARTSKVKITDSDIVQRKLSEVATTLTIEVPWSAYENYCAYLEGTLSDEGTDVDIGAIQMNEAVLKMFEKRVAQFTKSYVEDDLVDLICDEAYSDALKLFAKEVKEAREEAERVRKERDNSKEVLIRELTDDGLILAVSQKNRTKAYNILQAAGLL